MNEKDTIIFTMDKKLKQQLMYEAKAKGLSLSSYIRVILINRRGKIEKGI